MKAAKRASFKGGPGTVKTFANESQFTLINTQVKASSDNLKLVFDLAL